MILTDEHIMARDNARNFAQREIAPHVHEWERDHVVPTDVLARLAGLGFMGLCVDPEWGGAGSDFVSYVLVTQEIAAADCGICNMMNVHNSPVCTALQEYGTGEQKDRLLRPLAAGEVFGAFLLTESEAGSDAAALKTRATLKDGRYVLNGTKHYVTSGQSAGMAMIIAVTDPDQGPRGMTCFVTPTDNPGYNVVRIEDKLGHRNCDTCQVVLDDMEVPAADVLGRPGEGYKIALASLTSSRIGVAAQAVGIARAALDQAVSYAHERRTFNKFLIEHQAVAFMLAEMATEVEVAHQMVLHTAQLQDAGKPCIREASMAKLFASEAAEKVCSKAMQVHGGCGYLRDFPVEKFYRDARLLQIYEGTSEIHKMVISRNLPGTTETA